MEKLKKRLHISCLIYLVVFIIIYLMNIDIFKTLDIILNILAVFAAVFVLSRVVMGKKYEEI